MVRISTRQAVAAATAFVCVLCGVSFAGAQDDGSEGVVATREHGYELELDPERLDAQRFERLVAEGRSELAADRPGGAVAALEGALSQIGRAHV